eukprot:6210784-Pleurochrysis_carterae.AAC.1
MGQRKAPGGERWRAAPGGERRARKARGDERWPAVTYMAVLDGSDKAHGALNIKLLMQRSVPS